MPSAEYSFKMMPELPVQFHSMQTGNQSINQSISDHHDAWPEATGCNAATHNQGIVQLGV